MPPHVARQARRRRRACVPVRKPSAICWQAWIGSTHFLIPLTGDRMAWRLRLRLFAGAASSCEILISLGPEGPAAYGYDPQPVRPVIERHARDW